MTATVKGREWYQENDIADEYDLKRFSRGGQLIDRREKTAVLNALHPIEGRRVLEIACGTGRFTVMLAAAGADIIGLDISEAMLSHGRQKAINLGLDDQVEFVRGDAARLPFPDNHFDTVLAMRFFHLMPAPEIFLGELCRVTKEQIVFDTFNKRSSRRAYNWLLPMGSHLYSENEVLQLLDGAGLYLESVEHEFVVPYGIYREIPQTVANAIYAVDQRLTDRWIGQWLASVSYWNACVKDN